MTKPPFSTPEIEMLRAEIRREKRKLKKLMPEPEPVMKTRLVIYDGSKDPPTNLTHEQISEMLK